MTDDPIPARITDAETAAALLPSLRTAPIEHAAIVLLDPEWRLLATVTFTGDRDGVAPPLRAIIRAALAHDAAGLILLHNHPSGHAEPSQADIAYTRALYDVSDPLDLALIDHVILTPDATTSFRARGLL